MASGKSTSPKRKHSRIRKTSILKNPNHIPIGKGKVVRKKVNEEVVGKDVIKSCSLINSGLSAKQQLSFFLERFQSANGIRLSSLELEEFRDNCMVELAEGISQDAGNITKHLKAAFGVSWKEVLCESRVLGGKISTGSPAALVVTASAMRSLEFIRGVRPLTKECKPAKLFAKHLKLTDQISILKERVNIACGTPSRIKRLIDLDALGISRLKLVILDMNVDVKGYSLLTLPQVCGEFWDLYKSHFHQQLLQGDLRINLYGPISSIEAKDIVARPE